MPTAHVWVSNQRLHSPGGSGDRAAGLAAHLATHPPSRQHRTNSETSRGGPLLMFGHCSPHLSAVTSSARLALKPATPSMQLARTCNECSTKAGPETWREKYSGEHASVLPCFYRSDIYVTYVWPSAASTASAISLPLSGQQNFSGRPPAFCVRWASSTSWRLQSITMSQHLRQLSFRCVW